MKQFHPGAYLREMRMHHYVKNGLLFVAVVCSGQMTNLSLIIRCLWGFGAFCAIASAVYFLNDIRDLEKDRLHPTKCRRPIASGQIPIDSAWLCTGVLCLLAFICNSRVFHPAATVLLLLYFILNLAYSFGLKNYPLVDVTILVSGFLIRVVYGAIICGISVSNWLYLTVIAVSFYLALGKRRNELTGQKGKDTRHVLQYYSESFLDKSMYMCLGLSNMFYALWTMDKAGTGTGGPIIWTVPLVLLISLKYSLTIEGESDADPVEVLLHDKFLLALCALFALYFVAILYV